MDSEKIYILYDTFRLNFFLHNYLYLLNLPLRFISKFYEIMKIFNYYWNVFYQNNQ